MPHIDNVPLIIALLATFSPILGALISLVIKPTENMISNMLSFAGGTMLAISFLQLLPEAVSLCGVPLTVVGVIVGTAIIYVLDKLIPHYHSDITQTEGILPHSAPKGPDGQLKRTATFLLLGIALHNLPEGIAMAITTTHDAHLGLSVALAIAFHNIPEGICSTAPYYAATGKKLRSFLNTALSGLPTLVGFLLGVWWFASFPPWVLGMMTAGAAGLMIYISGDELIPNGKSKAGNHSSIFSMMLGVLLVLLLGA